MAKEKNAPAATRKKLNQEIIALRDDDKEGKSTVGVLVSLEPMLGYDGQIRQGNFGQDLYTLELATDGGEVQKYWADGGVRGALMLAGLATRAPDRGAFALSEKAKNQKIEIVHTGERDIDTEDAQGKPIKGKTQTYDIYSVA